MSAIQALTDRAQSLGRSQDRWNDAYMVFVALTVLLAAAVFITQFIASRKGKQLAEVQGELLAEKDRQLAADLKAKDAKIAEANERAGLANERASKLEAGNITLRADLERATAESRSKQAELEREQQKTAAAQSKLAEEQRKTAEAQEKASKLQSVLASVVRRTGVRTLDSTKFVEKLSGKPRLYVDIVYKPRDQEAERFSQDIFRGFQTAKWPVNPPREATEEEMKPFGGGYLGSGLELHFHTLTRQQDEIGEALAMATNLVGVAVCTTDPSVPEGHVVIFVTQAIMR